MNTYLNKTCGMAAAICLAFSAQAAHAGLDKTAADILGMSSAESVMNPNGPSICTGSCNYSYFTFRDSDGTILSTNWRSHVSVRGVIYFNAATFYENPRGLEAPTGRSQRACRQSAQKMCDFLRDNPDRGKCDVIRLDPAPHNNALKSPIRVRCH